MSGHSKWANIQHRKGRQDAKRGKEFTKAAKEIIIAAKNGGILPVIPACVRPLLLPSRSTSPRIKSKPPSARYRAGCRRRHHRNQLRRLRSGRRRVIVETATDNRNRTVAEIRHLMSKGGGSMGENGCVSWKFERKGVIQFSKESTPKTS